jgi:hypothetical protein
VAQGAEFPLYKHEELSSKPYSLPKKAFTVRETYSVWLPMFNPRQKQELLYPTEPLDFYHYQHQSTNMLLSPLKMPNFKAKVLFFSEGISLIF